MLRGQRIELGTDGFGLYQRVVDAIWRGNIDYGIVVKGRGQVTPTMAAGVAAQPWLITQLCELLEPN